jgi:hypothetical protein
MKPLFGIFSFSLCATLVIFWPPPASEQSSAAGAGASACAIPAAKLLPEAPAATASNPRSALLRRFAHVRDYVGCLRSHGVRPASSQMAAAATYVTFDVPGGVATSPTAINSVGTIAGLYFDANFVAAHSFVRAPGGALTPFDRLEPPEAPLPSPSTRGGRSQDSSATQPPATAIFVSPAATS